jgi:hypothetical protein
VLTQSECEHWSVPSRHSSTSAAGTGHAENDYAEPDSHLDVCHFGLVGHAVTGQCRWVIKTRIAKCTFVRYLPTTQCTVRLVSPGAAEPGARALLWCMRWARMYLRRRLRRGAAHSPRRIHTQYRFLSPGTCWSVERVMDQGARMRYKVDVSCCTFQPLFFKLDTK